MRGFTAVLSRELGLRKAIWAAALVAGLLPFLLAALPGMTYGYAEVRDASALAIAVGAGELLALVLGATVLGRELTERRLSFDFARPIGGLAIWAARMGAVLILSLGSALVILLPATLAGGGFVTLLTGATVRPETPWYLPAPGPLGMILLYVLNVLFLAALAHVLGALGRSRSPWLLLDAALFVAIGLVVFLAGRGLYRQDAFLGLAAGGLGCAVLLVTTLLAAGAAQVIHGRTDPRAGHRALSTTLWSLCAVGALGFAGYARWYTHVSPADLANIQSAQVSPGGQWISVWGGARHRSDLSPDFLYNPTTGASLRLNIQWWGDAPAFSEDGSRAAWVAGRDRREIMTAGLGAAQPVAAKTGIEVAGLDWRLALSPSGRRLAVLSDGTLSVYELAGGRLLASARVLNRSEEKRQEEVFWKSRMLFPDEGHVALFGVLSPKASQSTSSVTLQRFNLASRKLETTGEIGGLAGSIFVTPDRTGSRLIVSQKEDHWTSSLRDGLTGALITPLGPEGHAIRAAFLPEGGVVAWSRAKGESELWLYGEDGALKTTANLGHIGEVVFGSEPRPGELFVGTAPAVKEWYWHLSLVSVECATGSSRLVAAGLAPLFGTWWPSGQVLSTGPAALLALAPDRSLVRVDPATGQQTTLIRGTLKPKE
ncbi:MAG: hypothetical protein WBS54_02470 [Acidobacteriota bacterium]